jgi:hypothetical protein
MSSLICVRVCILVSLLLFAFVHVVSADTCTKDPISCALDDITIYVPDVEIPVPPNTVLYLKDFICNEVQIQSFPSQFIPPSTVGVDLNGFHMKCVGNYEYHAELLTYKGVMTAIVKDTSIDIDYLLGQDPNSEFPAMMKFSSCSIPSIHFDISFTGGILSGLLNLLSGAVEAFLEKEMNTFICVDMAEFVEKNGTYFLTHTLNPALEDLIANEPSPYPALSYYDNSYINWRHSIFSLAEKVSESTVIDKLGHCVVEHLPVDMQPQFMHRPWINGLFEVLTGGTGTLVIPVNNTDVLRPIAKLILKLLANETSLIPIHIDTHHPYQNITATLENVEISGLDTFQELKIMQPVIESNMTLSTVIVLDKFHLVLDYKIETPDAAYAEKIRINLEISEIAIDVKLGLGVNGTFLSTLFLDQLLHPGCMVKSIGFFNVSKLSIHAVFDDLSVTSIGEHPLAQLNADLIALADNVILLLTDGYGQLLTDTLQGAMEGPVRQSLNALVNSIIAKVKGEPESAELDMDMADFPTSLSCPAHHPISPVLVHWWNSTLVESLDELINSKFGANGMNRFISCMTGHTGKVTYESQHWGIELGGLDSFSNLRVFGPYKYPDSVANPYNLVTSLEFGYCPEDEFGVVDTNSGVCNPFYFKFYSIGSDGEGIIQQSNSGQSNREPDVMEEVMSRFIAVLNGIDKATKYGTNLVEYKQEPLSDEDKEKAIVAFMNGYSSSVMSLHEQQMAAVQAVGAHMNQLWTTVLSQGKIGSVRLIDIFPDTSYILGLPPMPPMPPLPPLPAGISIRLEIQNFNFLLDLLAKVDKATIEGLRGRELRTTGCMAQSFRQLQFYDFEMSLTNSSLVVHFPDADIHQDLTGAFTQLLQFMTRPAAVSTINANIEKRLANAPTVCSNGGVIPHTNDDVIIENADQTWTYAIFIIVGGSIAAFLFFLYLYYYYGERAKCRCLRLIWGLSDEEREAEEELLRLKAIHRSEVVAAASRDGSGEGGSWYDRWGFKDALICRQEFPLYVRVGLVVAVIGDMLCFLFSNLAPDAVVVMASVNLGPKVFTPPPVFSFGLASTVRDSKWNTYQPLFHIG